MTLKEDLFWSVSADELFSVGAEPQALTIVQLSESWQHLEDLLAHEDRAVGYHLVWLANVIRAIGQDIPKQGCRVTNRASGEARFIPTDGRRRAGR
ncbi:hypothetical protein [Streptomyces sp. NBC_01465]|uniref:hypothetical protein n=1 Tax=Streptomyces sp. NBC_01465 TaxID=2903878 RepID=UPI002E325E75|nr:hypothetical protein [Streptomyces sp. NBC_01465]